MGVPSRILNHYSSEERNVEAVARLVSQTLRPWCDRKGFPFKGRRKSLQSLSEKLESGRYSKWSELDDLYACTIVLPTPQHEEATLEFLSQAFTPVQVRRRNSTKKAPDVFRFDSTRFIGTVRVGEGLPLPQELGLIKFEVQLPTAFEYAWSVVTHDLVYKTDDFDWRKARMAALLKAAVEQIELLISGFSANVGIIPQSSHPESDAKHEAVQAFKSLIEEGFIDRQLTPESWSRFADNLFSLVASYSNRNAAPQKLLDLTAAIGERARETGEYSTIVSGSLFQIPVGCISAGIVSGANLSKFVIVDSVELRDIHGVEKVPRPFRFEDDSKKTGSG
ncbi:hypothetical protein SUDANB176_05063 [Streptomyces sp. enrichment culture]|uniref:hypothetical protein n=1 Tax=Streptomyces sp. enrichment culture TaxID=1795815 RepID=UPI003F56CBFA